MKRTTTVLTILMALLVAVAAGAGVLFPGGGAPVSFTTARGEQALLQSTGFYRDLPVAIAREGFIWDMVNLFIGVPALIAALLATRRGSLRGRLALAGLSLYFAYVYLTWATLVFNPLFLVYVATLGLSLVNLFLVLGNLDAAEVRAHVSRRFPRRFFAAFAFASAGIITLLWIARIVDILRTGHFPPELAGLTSLETQALDLGVVVPLSVMSGILLLRDHPWGYVLTALHLTFGFMMFLTIPAWIAVPLVQEGRIRILEAAPFLLLCAAGFVLVALFLGNLDEHPRVASA